ncbi:hypothetical protein CPter291_0553 [Collimonas pratensis]|uniref:Uncharacterized protein n=1 Tax=Collimonas pratensis TaxID=279113 RepID=A0ABN4M561_9BURK|nr:hypothetical protein CPter291_0553 [Collimonas pratensis]
MLTSSFRNHLFLRNDANPALNTLASSKKYAAIKTRSVDI